MRRSTSLREHRRSGSWSGFEPIERPPVEPCHCGGSPTNTEEKPFNSLAEVPSNQRPNTAADLQNLMNAAREAPRPVVTSPTASPVPPCPPLRGEDFYPEQENIGFGRDSLYCSVRRPRRLPPRPPQRTVSFLASESTARLNPGMPTTTSQHRPSISASCLPSHHPRGLSLPVPTEVTSHNRSFSSPDAQPLYQSLQKRSPLPPPPYVPPPTMQRSSPNEPLPPPPEHIERPPCDSVSSIDSGFRSSCSDSTSSTEAASVPTSPCQPFLEVPEDPYSYWVGSPALLTSPDNTAQFYRATVSHESLYVPRSQVPCTAPCYCPQ